MDSRYPPDATPSQHGEPCPWEGDETARYATLIEELKIVGWAVVGTLALGFVAYQTWIHI